MIKTLTEKIDHLLREKRYDQIIDLLNDNKDAITQSNELSYLYYLFEINAEEYKENTGVGIIADKNSVDEIIDVFYSLKRMVQRTAYCNEYDATAVLRYMNTIKATSKELLWTINSSTINPAETLSKIRGEYIHKEESEYIPKNEYDNVGIDFIICSNDPGELDETIFYINRLNVPSGVTVNVLSIVDAASICQGYNEGMQASSARYKVYLHQDVRIIDKDFIPRLIDLFMDNKGVGLIGLIGTNSFPKDGAMWSIDRYGAVLETHVHETLELRNYADSKNIDAVVCDGFLLATQYDLPWREDLFDGWDMYDASQCMEFIRAGYGVMIPYQEKAWCLHDCGFVHLRNYERYRNIFLKEYA